MAGYIGSKSSVTQVDGYTRAEADAAFVKPNDSVTFSDTTVTGAFTSRGIDDNATSTAVILDASGNLLVGNTSYNANNTGVLAGNNGSLYATRDTGPSAYFNRLSSDGDIAVFRKDGSTVGSIGTTGSTFPGTVTAGAFSGDGSGLTNVSVLPTGGSVGSYALLCPANNASVSYAINTTVAGSSLEWNGTRNGLDIDSLAYNYTMGSPSGTWRLCQPYPSGVNISMANLIWQRIS